MARLKVLFITNWYPTTEEPAKAVWAREHARAVRIYDDVVVLHCVGSDFDLKSCWVMTPESDPRLSYGIPTHRVQHRRSRIPHASYLIYLWAIWGAFQRLVDEGFRPDVIHVHIYDAGWPALLIGTLHHIPVVVSEHFSSFPRGSLTRLDVGKAWLAFRWASRVLTVSYALQEAIERYGIRSRFQVVPNVVDTMLFSPCAQRLTDADPKRLLLVGQLVPVKGVPYLLQALSDLREKRDDWHLDIVGDGGRRMEYEQLAVDLKLCDKVTFHGLKPKPEVAKFMRRADLFVLPSLFETFSTPAAEALATGTPVLSTRCGGPEEFVVNDVGFLVSPGDADALRSGLDYMLDRLHRYSRMEISQYARERFSLEVVGAQLHAMYQAVSADAQAARKTRTASSPRSGG